MRNLSESILLTLPYLRRYARALTGSQTLGDIQVRLCLEAMLSAPWTVDPQMDSRVEVFALFHHIRDRFRTPAGDSGAPESGAEEPGIDDHNALAESLHALPPLERQVLLLVSLEEFSFQETAYILDLSIDQVRDLVAQARADMGRGPLADILIIEDDPIIALDIAGIVRNMGFSVAGVASRRDEAVEMAETRRPTLVLADVQLAEGDDGVSTVQEILRAMTVPVIFVTGHPDRVLTGNALEPAFVIAKPYEPNVLKTAIDHALMPRPAGVP